MDKDEQYFYSFQEEIPSEFKKVLYRLKSGNLSDIEKEDPSTSKPPFSDGESFIVKKFDHNLTIFTEKKTKANTNKTKRYEEILENFNFKCISIEDETSNWKMVVKSSPKDSYNGEIDNIEVITVDQNNFNSLT